MKYALILLIVIVLGLCGGGYYEYTVFQGQLAAAQEHSADLNDQVNKLQTKNKQLQDQIGTLQDQNKGQEEKNQELQAGNQKLQADNTRMEKDATDAQTKITDLTAQIQTIQSQLATAQQALTAATSTNNVAPSAPAHRSGPSPNDLGTIVAHNGKTYENCHLLKVERDGLTFSHADGTDKVSWGMLPSALQERFGYDPSQGTGLSPAQADYQEDRRRAAEAGSN